MNCFYALIFVFLPLTLAYASSHSNSFDRFFEKYLKERSENIHEITNPDLNEKLVARRQFMFPLLSIQQHQQHVQPMCLPHIWTCGPGLPPCCAGLMCYDGNAKRGRLCVARG